MKKRTTVIAASLIAAGIIFISAGTANGGAEALHQQSSIVCLECIGIG